MLLSLIRIQYERSPIDMIELLPLKTKSPDVKSCEVSKKDCQMQYQFPIAIIIQYPTPDKNMYLHSVVFISATTSTKPWRG